MTARHLKALRDVAEAARKAEEARVEYEDTTDRLLKKKREADEKLREALRVAAELVGESLPVSERDKASQELKDMLDKKKK